MSFDFPASPADGTIYAPPTGPQYQFTGGAWRVASSSVPVATAQARNRIVNGAMQISQENAKTTAYGGNDTFDADQWQSGFTTTGTANHGCFQDATDANVDWYIRLNSTVADTSIAAGEYFRLRQVIEGIRVADFRWGTAQAKQVILRFRARSSILGTFCASISLFAVNTSFTKNCTFTQVNVWQEFTVVVPGATTGTWPINTAASVVVAFTVMAGSVYTAPADGVWSNGQFFASPGISNWMSAVGQTFDIANVGLYADPLNTGVAPRWEMPDEAQEWQTCQRYYQRISTCVNSGVATAGGQNIYGFMSLRPEMRITPAAAITGASYINAAGLVAYTVTAQAFTSVMGSSAAGVCVSNHATTLNARM